MVDSEGMEETVEKAVDLDFVGPHSEAGLVLRKGRAKEKKAMTATEQVTLEKLHQAATEVSH